MWLLLHWYITLTTFHTQFFSSCGQRAIFPSKLSAPASRIYQLHGEKRMPPANDNMMLAKQLIASRIQNYLYMQYNNNLAATRDIELRREKKTDLNEEMRDKKMLLITLSIYITNIFERIQRIDEKRAPIMHKVVFIQMKKSARGSIEKRREKNTNIDKFKLQKPWLMNISGIHYDHIFSLSHTCVSINHRTDSVLLNTITTTITQKRYNTQKCRVKQQITPQNAPKMR